jgi:ribosomal protein L40E
MSKAKFPEAVARIYEGVFICMKCGAKKRAALAKVRAGKINCRKCRSTKLRQIHKEFKK